MNIKYGLHCLLIHDFPEPEGVVWFDEMPKEGDRFNLPSAPDQVWQVKSVNPDDLSFTAIRPTGDD